MVCGGTEKVWATKGADVENAHETHLPRFFLAFICDVFFHWGVGLNPLRNEGGGVL